METETNFAHNQDNVTNEQSQVLKIEISFGEGASHTKRKLLLCRLCSFFGENGIMIFGDEGLKLCLQQHIKKYLYITVTMDDKLTKFVCSGCVNTLENFHRFALNASQSQRNLINASKTEENVENANINPKYSILQGYLTEDHIVNDHDYVASNRTTCASLQAESWNQPESTNQKNTRSHENKPKTKLRKARKRKGKENKFTKELTDSVRQTKFAIDDQVTSDSNTHETLEVVVDPSLYLESSCDSFEDNSESMNPICLICGKETPDQGNNTCVHTHSNENNNNDDETISPVSIERMIEADNSNLNYVCPICGKNYITQRSLFLHLRIHRPKGKYECNICKRIFKTNANLLQHKMFHTRVQHQCQTCSRVYSTHSTLKAHAITHSDLRPHKCQLCEKSFKRNQDLKFHMNQHTGERPYKCIYCSRAFASSGNCFSHRKRMHPNEMERDQNFAAKILQ